MVVIKTFVRNSKAGKGEGPRECSEVVWKEPDRKTYKFGNG